MQVVHACLVHAALLGVQRRPCEFVSVYPRCRLRRRFSPLIGVRRSDGGVVVVKSPQCRRRGRTRRPRDRSLKECRGVSGARGGSSRKARVSVQRAEREPLCSRSEGFVPVLRVNSGRDAIHRVPFASCLPLQNNAVHRSFNYGGSRPE